MAKIYKTALGKQIDIDHLALTNEHVIAVGNYKVNARGDELGAGGKIIKTRDQIMKEYYALNTPVAMDPPMPQSKASVPVARAKAAPVQADPVPADPVVFNPASGLDEVEEEPEIYEQRVLIDTSNSTLVETAASASTVVEAVKTAELPPAAPPVNRSNPEIRGSLASSVAKTATVTQVELLPPKKANGVQRF